MLNLNLSLTVQLLINLFAFVILKQFTPRGRLKGSGGCSMGSSLPRHDAKIRTKTQSRTKEKTKGRLQVSTKKNRAKNLYDA